MTLAHLWLLRSLHQNLHECTQNISEILGLEKLFVLLKS